MTRRCSQLSETDEHIDHILQALGSTQAPGRLTQRVLSSVERRATAAGTKGVFSRLYPSRRWTTAIPLAALLTIAAALTVHELRPAAPRRNHTSLKQAEISSSRVPAGSTAPRTRPGRFMEGREPAHAAGALFSAAPGGGYASLPASPRLQAQPQQALVDLDSLALAETLAASHPAPPMPLTTQERLLLLASRRNGAIEVAELESPRAPTFRDAANAHERVSVRDFLQGILAPLAAAQALGAPMSSTIPDDAQTIAAAEPLSQ